MPWNERERQLGLLLQLNLVVARELFDRCLPRQMRPGLTVALDSNMMQYVRVMLHSPFIDSIASVSQIASQDIMLRQNAVFVMVDSKI